MDSFVIEKGKIYNISFDGTKVVSGWLLLITEEKKEYLIRQNSGLIGSGKYKIQRKIYKTNFSLKNYAIEGIELKKRLKKKSEYNFIGITASLILGAMLRNNIPKNWIWGDTNLPINVITGMLNLLSFWLCIVLCFSVISFYRKIFFEYNLKKNKGNLVLIGKGYESKKYRENEEIKKKLNLIPVIMMLCFFIALTIISPFIVQERLFAFIMTVILGALFFNGNVYSDKKTVNYKIIGLEKKYENN